MSATHCPTELSLGRDRVAVGHSQVRHPVQRRTPHKQLSGLSRKGASTDPFTKDRLDSKDLRLSQRPPMIARLTFPLSASLLSDCSQVLITNMSLGFRITVLPYLRSLLRRNAGLRLSFSDGVIAVAAIIGSISRDLAQLIRDLLQQVRQ